MPYEAEQIAEQHGYSLDIRSLDAFRHSLAAMDSFTRGLVLNAVERDAERIRVINNNRKIVGDLE